MFSNLGFGEFLMIGVLGMVIFGPERLPKAVADAVRTIRRLKAMADTAVSDFKADLPPELSDLDLRSMDPRRIVKDLVLDGTSGSGEKLDATGRLPRGPLPEGYDDDDSDFGSGDQMPGQTALLDESLRPS